MVQPENGSPEQASDAIQDRIWGGGEINYTFHFRISLAATNLLGFSHLPLSNLSRIMCVRSLWQSFDFPDVPNGPRHGNIMLGICILAVKM